MTRRSLAAAVFVVLACVDPNAPSAVPTTAVDAAPLPSVTGAPSLVLVAPGQLVLLELANGETQRAWVQSEILVRDAGPRDAAPISDGAILVVSAADGPMPQASPDAEMLRVAIEWASVGSDGIIRFDGVATLTDAGGKTTTFDIAGSAQAQADCCDGDDYIVWDIVGGNVHVTFESRGVMRLASAG